MRLVVSSLDVRHADEIVREISQPALAGQESQGTQTISPINIQTTPHSQRANCCHGWRKPLLAARLDLLTLVELGVLALLGLRDVGRGAGAVLRGRRGMAHAAQQGACGAAVAVCGAGAGQEQKREARLTAPTSPGFPTLGALRAILAACHRSVRADQHAPRVAPG